MFLQVRWHNQMTQLSLTDAMVKAAYSVITTMACTFLYSSYLTFDWLDAATAAKTMFSLSVTGKFVQELLPVRLGSQNWIFGIVKSLLELRCPSCRPTNGVKKHWKICGHYTGTCQSDNARHTTTSDHGTVLRLYCPVSQGLPNAKYCL